MGRLTEATRAETRETQRRELLETAVSILETDGPEALKLRDVAAQAGCSTWVIYKIFESKDGLRDTALLLIDRDGELEISDDGDTTTIPTLVNPDFGSVLLPSSPGRVLRIGLRIGG